MPRGITRKNLSEQLNEIKAAIDKIQPIQESAENFLAATKRISMLEKENKEIRTGLSDISNKVSILVIVILISFSDDMFKAMSPTNPYLTYSDVVAMLAVVLGMTALVSKQIGGVIGTVKSKMGK